MALRLEELIMNLHRWQLKAAWLPGFAAIVVLAAGCGDDAVPESGLNGDVPEMSIDLAAENGGLSATDEKPYFGDAYFSAHLGEGSDVEVRGDPLATDPSIADLESRPDTKVLFVRVVWGNLHRAPDAPDETDGERIDWSGQARVSDGILRPLRTLRFERGDYLVPPWLQPDPSRQKVVWVSHTGPGKDGLLLKIVVPAADDSTLTSAGLAPLGDGLTADDRFTFATGPLTVSFPLAGIADLDSVILVDDENGVSFLGFDREDLDICPQGTLDGAWVRVQDDPFLGGFFRARWMGPLGNVIGHLRGRWGVLPEGHKVFVGKLISRDGTFLAFVRGGWEPSAEDPTRGTFNGAWRIPDRAEGRLRGMWAVSRRFEDGGFLRGGWAADCNREPAL